MDAGEEVFEEVAGGAPGVERGQAQAGVLWVGVRTGVALASAGAVVALVPRSALRGTDLTGVAVRPVGSALATRRVFAATRVGVDTHPLLRPVLEVLAEAAPEE